MKARLHKIESALLPLPYSYLAKLYGFAYANKEDDVNAMLAELTEAQFIELQSFEKAFYEYRKRKFGNDKETKEETDSEADRATTTSGA